MYRFTSARRGAAQEEQITITGSIMVYLKL
jgi:hypothetical protein